jgi:uncharacterized protein (TIGR00369 family)
MPDQVDLDVLRAAFRDFVPHNKAIGLELVEVSLKPAVAVLSLPFDPRLVGNPETGHFHGGVITTLLDATCGASVFLKLANPTPIATLDLRVDYLGPGTPGRGCFARAECFKVTRNVAFVRGLAYHDTPDEPFATAAATFMISTPGKSVVGAAYEKHS